MAWIRVSDTFNSAPEWMKARELAVDRRDGRLVAELRGHAMAMFAWSAQNFTDYVVPLGAAVEICGVDRVEQVLADLVTIGICEVADADGERRWRLVERASFVHLIKSDQKLLNAKRKRDQRKASLVVPVLLRDGSECRYCGEQVNWDDHRHEGGGTFDHRDVEAETTTENYVVACRGCNRLRADFDDPDEQLPLLDPPEQPIYDAQLCKKLAVWPRIVAAEASRMGFPNPLVSHGELGKVESPSRRGRPNGLNAVESESGRVQSPEPPARPVGVDPQVAASHPVRKTRPANGTGFLGNDSGTRTETKRRRKRRRR
ncbi:hypothetical protein HMPREF3088_05615 [Corynebacterium sp. HMSC22B11]|uniref:HNH endonuclease n=1 Tax=Corynebacterium urealyticum TaxID=43771 RepID=A0A2W5BBX1_9CORY|nr:HNH endonuclease [Corynebacterium sp. HMSC22B11]OFO13397.1 hypothetical protein HMPREF3088_05615 [Corynebacterium sp. HMSC22B11]PZP02787.1 MAG: hypothetical protein DI609_01930 [Corynebacterium urealyticum]